MKALINGVEVDYDYGDAEKIREYIAQIEGLRQRIAALERAATRCAYEQRMTDARIVYDVAHNEDDDSCFIVLMNAFRAIAGEYAERMT